jgi:hypothetical protein
VRNAESCKLISPIRGESISFCILNFLVLIERRNFWNLHGRWFVATAGASAAALAWCILWYIRNGRWPGGGSWPGLALGALAAIIFLFELALVAKKTRLLRTARWSLSAQTWMKAHIWLGLLTVPLVLLHSGADFGGTLTTLLMAAFGIVIVSGLWGLAVQNYLPTMLLEAAPAETIYSQIDAVGRQYAAEAQRLVLLYCGGDAEIEALARQEPRPPGPEMSHANDTSSVVIAGAARQVGPQIARSPQPQAELPRQVPSPVIHEALRDCIEPFLAGETESAGPLGSKQRNDWYFEDLRLRVAPELRGLVGQLEGLCERRRQLNVQRRLHFWLHNWLFFHLPLSLVLVALLAGHVIFALRYG